MAKYPIKMLKDEEGTPFVPLVSADSVYVDADTTFQDSLDKKLEITNLKGSDSVSITKQGNDATFEVNFGAANNIIDNLNTTVAGQGSLDARQGNVLKNMIPAIADNLTTTDANKVLSANQGKVLGERTVKNGGTTGQVLKKASDNDYDLEWGDAADPNAIVGDGSITSIIELTYEEYKALEAAGNVDPNTEYHITDAQSTISKLQETLDGLQSQLNEIKSTYLPLSGGSLTGDLAVSSSFPIIRLRDTINTHDVTPSTSVFPALLWVDKDYKAMGRLELIEANDGSRVMSLYALKPGSTSGGSFFKVGWDSSGNKISTLDGPLTIYDNLVVNGSITVGSGFGKKYTFKQTITLTTEWQDTGIMYNSMPAGEYIVFMTGIYDTNKGWQSDNRYVGLMTWYTGGTNSSERYEIALHSGGHAHNGYEIQLSTLSHANGRTTLQIKSNIAFTRPTEVTFVFTKI